MKLALVEGRSGLGIRWASKHASPSRLVEGTLPPSGGDLEKRCLSPLGRDIIGGREERVTNDRLAFLVRSP